MSYLILKVIEQGPRGPRTGVRKPFDKWDTMGLEQELIECFGDQTLQQNLCQYYITVFSSLSK